MTLIKKWLLRLLLLLAFIVALLAASDNSQPVSLKFLDFSSAEWPVAWWMLAAFVLGVLFGMVLNFLTNSRLRRDARRANRTVDAAQKALDKARAGEDAPVSTD